MANEADNKKSKRPSLDYDVALSFAGEDRALAESLATLLVRQGLRVFYDRYEQADLWGKDLYQHLQSIYCDKAFLCVVFLSEAYAQKLWTRHELKQAQERAFRESREYILPLRLDDTQIPGINETTGYLDLRSCSIERVADLLKEKLSKLQSGVAGHPQSTISSHSASSVITSRVPSVVFEGISHKQKLVNLDFSLFNVTSDLLIVSQVAVEVLYLDEISTPVLHGIIDREAIAPFPHFALGIIATPERTKLIVRLTKAADADMHDRRVTIATYEFEPEKKNSGPHSRDVVIQVPAGQAHSFSLALDYQGENYNGILGFIIVHIRYASKERVTEIILDAVFEVYREPEAHSLGVIPHQIVLRDAFQEQDSFDIERVLGYLESEDFSDTFLQHVANRACKVVLDLPTWERLLSFLISRMITTCNSRRPSAFLNDALIKALKVVPVECVHAHIDLFSGLYESSCPNLYRICGARVASGLPLLPRTDSGGLDRSPQTSAMAVVSEEQLRSLCKKIIASPYSANEKEVLQGRIEAILTLAELGDQNSIHSLFGVVYQDGDYCYDAARALALVKGRHFSGETPSFIYWWRRNLVSHFGRGICLMGLVSWVVLSVSTFLNPLQSFRKWNVLGLSSLSLLLLLVLVERVFGWLCKRAWQTGLEELETWYGYRRRPGREAPLPVAAPVREDVFEIRIVIEASIEDVFDVFADPQKAAVAAGAPTPKKVRRTSTVEGTSWTVWHGLWHRSHYTITDYARPNRIIKQITGSVVAIVEDNLESNGTSTVVVRKFAVSRLLSPYTVLEYRHGQQNFLQRIKEYIEAKC